MNVDIGSAGYAYNIKYDSVRGLNDDESHSVQFEMNVLELFLSIDGKELTENGEFIMPMINNIIQIGKETIFIGFF